MIQLTPKEEEARKRVCLPLDGLETLDAVKARVEELIPVVGLFKVGMESFTDFGPDVIKLVKDYGANVFLDLKFGDIPKTAAGAARAATKHGVYMFNFHALCGSEALKAAKESAEDAAIEYGVTVPKLLGVTILTSLDQKRMNEELRIPGSVEDQVLHLAKLTDGTGLDGIVCSAADLLLVRPYLRARFMYVTPGIEGPKTPAGSDQKRVMTPGNAIKAGSSILVVGRAITGPKTPDERLQAGYEVLQDMVPYI